MKREARIIEGVMRMKFEEIYDRFQKGRLTTQEAAELLSVSVSTFYRKRERYREEGFEGTYGDRRLGRVSPHRAEDGEVRWSLYDTYFVNDLL
ncbi:helix-turn-helix domain-containing protein [Candidatus Nucleicultrix amoebiphila]|uniref:Uncharacterized protein n=1 Tax=Candidatus Nucleicultrix amoebiphila FS5 TaxID=1414854 RepID=A0A1W6N5Y5_9PROT|nr:helix-turn-helix domain-containing protein [Candidatus Nucleicultrix amoebiphila]ARN85254.1 hypothetical protein GQ61_08085 [Candidatus Nucleicultrix amoebiphila FS5]